MGLIITFPVYFHVGPLSLPAHLIFETFSYVVGYRAYLIYRKKQGDQISEENRLWIFIGAAIGAFLGAHMLGMLEKPIEIFRSNWLFIFTNKTIVGGLLGGLIGVELVKKRLGVKTSSGDLITFPIIIALMIGRIGCFLQGLEDGTYGIATSLPWGVDFGDHVHRHPTQLYEILFLAILWFTISALEKKRNLRNGARFKIFMIAYLTYRFVIEFFKPAYFTLAELTVIQWSCVGGLLYYYKSIFRPKTLIDA